MSNERKSVVPNLQLAPVVLFDATVNQAGSSQKGVFFPTTIAISGGALPAINTGTSGITLLTNAGNTVGAVFSPLSTWDSVLLDFAGVGNASGNTITFEIGRLKASGAVPDVLCSAVLTSSATTLGATTTNPFTGATGHASVTWRFMDVVALTNYDVLGSVLTSVSGVSGNGPAQLKLNCHDASYYYLQITALNANFTETLVCMTPTS
jgi:hypothetical protein